jgi:hypothetical protein
MQLTLKSDIKQLKRSLNKFERQVIPQATNRTINRVGGKVQTQVRRHVAKEVGITQKALNQRGFFSRVRSSVRTLTFSVIVKYGAIPLKDFNPRQTARGVTAKAWGNRKTYDGAFVSEKLGRHVFVRKTGKRLPIKKLYGPIPSRLTTTPAVERKVADVVNDSFMIEMRRNIKFYADKLIAKRSRR